MIAKVAFFFILLVPLLAQASCFEAAAARYDMDADLLKALAWQESHGHANAVGVPLADGNIAVGEMQINTVHMPELEPYGIRRQDLFDGCKSIYIGAWVLANCVKDVGRTWNSVGCYFAGKKSKKTAAVAAYVKSVKMHYLGYVWQREAMLEKQAARRAEAASVSSPQPVRLVSSASKPQMKVWSAND